MRVRELKLKMEIYQSGSQAGCKGPDVRTWAEKSREPTLPIHMVAFRWVWEASADLFFFFFFFTCELRGVALDLCQPDIL